MKFVLLPLSAQWDPAALATTTCFPRCCDTFPRRDCTLSSHRTSPPGSKCSWIPASICLAMGCCHQPLAAQQLPPQALRRVALPLALRAAASRHSLSWMRQPPAEALRSSSPLGRQEQRLRLQMAAARAAAKALLVVALWRRQAVQEATAMATALATATAWRRQTAMWPPWRTAVAMPCWAAPARASRWVEGSREALPAAR